MVRVFDRVRVFVRDRVAVWLRVGWIGSRVLVDVLEGSPVRLAVRVAVVDPDGARVWVSLGDPV